MPVAGSTGRITGRASCVGAADGSGTIKFEGLNLARVDMAAQCVITLPVEPTAAISWLFSLGMLAMFTLPGGASLGPMTVLDGDTLAFSCSSGLVEGETYTATLIGYRQALDDPNFQFLLPSGVLTSVSGSGSVSGITEIESPDESVDVINPMGPVVGLKMPPPAPTYYAALTGDGETETPGSLALAGGLEIDIPAGLPGVALAVVNRSAAAGIVFTNMGGSGGMQFIDYGTGGVLLQASTQVGLFGATVSIAAAGAAPEGAVTIHAPGAGLTLAETGDKLGFFSKTPAAQIAGSGITTLAELITALQTYGLLS
jgi:hypothetical protein